MNIDKYKSKSGKTKWKFSHYLGIDPNTGQSTQAFAEGFSTKAEARKELLRMIREFDRISNLSKNTHQQVHFEEVANLWLVHYKKQVKVTTYTNRRNLIHTHIFPYFKDYYIDRITIDMCQEAINDWYSSFSEASRLANLVINIFKYGINQGFCDDNPMTKTLRPRNTHQTVYEAPYFEKNELQKFLATVQKNESIKAYTMFHTLAFTGLRRGELFGLQWRDINFKEKVLAVERNLIYNELHKEFEFSTPKSKASRRVIGIDNTTIQILLKWQAAQRMFFLEEGIDCMVEDQLVFTSQTNHYMTDAYLRRIITRMTEKHGLPHITIHGFRHTHCSLLFEAGVEMHNVKNRLGHSDIQTTINIYNHVTEQERSSTADLFSDFMQDDIEEIQDDTD